MNQQALTQDYPDLLARGEIAAPGGAPAKLRYALCLDEDGQLTQVVPTMEEVPKGKKTVSQPQSKPLPAPVKRASNIASNFLWDNSSYLLGIDQKGKTARSRECFSAAAARRAMMSVWFLGFGPYVLMTAVQKLPSS